MTLTLHQCHCINSLLKQASFFTGPGIYHDGGSGLWNDHFNVFNHIRTSGVFAHGSSAHTTVVDMWLNDTQGLALEGDTNRDVRDPVTGACIDDPLNLTRQGTKDGARLSVSVSVVVAVSRAAPDSFDLGSSPSNDGISVDCMRRPPRRRSVPHLLRPVG